MEKRRKTVQVIIIAGQIAARLEIGELLPGENRGQRIASLIRLQIVDPDYLVTIHVRGQSPRKIRLGDLSLDPQNESAGYEPSIKYDRVVRGLSTDEARALRDSRPPAPPSISAA